MKKQNLIKLTLTLAALIGCSILAGRTEAMNNNICNNNPSVRRIHRGKSIHAAPLGTPQYNDKIPSSYCGETICGKDYEGYDKAEYKRI